MGGNREAHQPLRAQNEERRLCFARRLHRHADLRHIRSPVCSHSFLNGASNINSFARRNRKAFSTKSDIALGRKQLRWLKAAAEEILDAAMKAINELDVGSVERMIQMLLDARDMKIFVVGMGRSGFVGRAFALRLMNLGFNVYFLGETITPAAEKDDLVVAISGTGETKMVLTASSATKEIGAKVVAVTSYPESPLGKIADHVVVIRGRTKTGWPREEDYLVRQILGERGSP